MGLSYEDMMFGPPQRDARRGVLSWLEALKKNAEKASNARNAKPKLKPQDMDMMQQNISAIPKISISCVIYMEVIW